MPTFLSLPEMNYFSMQVRFLKPAKVITRLLLFFKTTVVPWKSDIVTEGAIKYLIKGFNLTIINM